MQLAIIGAGYVGLTSAAVFAELGNTVWAVRKDAEKVEMLKRGEIPFYEPGLAEIVKRNVEAGRLIPTVSYAEAVPPAEVIFICVGTPSSPSGEVDMSQVFAAAEEIAENWHPQNVGPGLVPGRGGEPNAPERRGTSPCPTVRGRQGPALQNYGSYKVIVNKSTVPIGTAEQVKEIIYDGISKNAGSFPRQGRDQDDALRHFEMASCPEFLRQGSAVYDTLNPDRIVIGTENGSRVREILLELHKPLPGERVFCDIKTAEMIKYASNAFLATSISFINNLAVLCEKAGADVTKVAEAMRLDRRIGKNAFIEAGCGYGGSCFPKDVKALINISRQAGAVNELLEAVEKVNQQQKELLLQKILSLVKEVGSPVIGVWGLSFKPKTDDLREAPSLYLIKELLKRNFKIKAYDPVAMENAKKIFPQISYCSDCFQAAEGADCLVIVTEWDEFKELDKGKLKSIMRSPNIVDGRNVYDPAEMRRLGFNYLSIGRP